MDCRTKSSSLRANVERTERTAALGESSDFKSQTRVSEIHSAAAAVSRFHHLPPQCASLTLIRGCVSKFIPQQNEVSACTGFFESFRG